MIHLHLHNIPILQELTSEEPNPARRPRHNDRPLPQRSPPRKMNNDLPHRPNHIARARPLLDLPIHPRSEIQLRRIANHARRHDRGPNRRKPIERFRIAVLPAADVGRHLEVPRGHVVADCVAEHGVEGVGRGGVFAVAPDDDRHLALPVHLRLRVGVHVDLVGGARQGIGGFDEDYGVAGDFELGTGWVSLVLLDLGGIFFAETETEVLTFASSAWCR